MCRLKFMRKCTRDCKKIASYSVRCSGLEYTITMIDVYLMNFFICLLLAPRLTPSMALYDTLQSLKSAVATQCVSYAYTLVAFLLAAGEKGARIAMPLARIALQAPAGTAHGQADDIQNEANELIGIRDYLFHELSAKTGQPVEKIHKDLTRRRRFNA